MTIRSFLGKKDLFKIEVSYQYHKPESGKLIVYNTGKCRCADITIHIVNQQEEVFRYGIEKLSVKTAECIDYTGQADLENKTFSGQIARVIVKNPRNEFEFIPQENHKFKAV